MDHLLLHFNVASVIWSVLSIALECPGLCLDVSLLSTIVGSPG
jgi:hypothetical protein